MCCELHDTCCVLCRYPENFRVDYALSREMQNKDGGKMYIQNKMEEYADQLFDLLDNGAHIYFCGLKGGLPLLYMHEWHALPFLSAAANSAVSGGCDGFRYSVIAFVALVMHDEHACGAGMMPGINDTLEKVATGKGLDFSEWSANLKKEGRFHVEVY